MKKFKKVLLGITSAAVAFAPVAGVVACNSDSMDLDKTIIIQAEKSWIPFYEKIVNEFKTKEKKLMEANGITNIKIIEMASLEVSDKFVSKGIRDTSVPDIFLVASDRFEGFLENKFLKPFSEKTSSKFLNDHLTDEEVAQAGRKFEVAATKISWEYEGKMYGVPENVEAMVEFYEKGQDKSKVKPVTKFSDLWMSAGFINTQTLNLKDIVWTDKDDKGKIKTVLNGDKPPQGFSIADESTATTMIKNGITKIVESVAGKNINQDAFQKDSGKADAELRKYFKNNVAKTSLYEGPWAINQLKTLLGKDVEAKEPTGWNQWGGGYSYSMNARVSDKKRTVMEELISYFYHTKFAKEMFKSIGKLTPITAGRDELKSDSIAESIYEASVLPKPNDSAFGSANVWDAYAVTMDRNKKALSEVTMSTKDALIEKISNEFIKAIKDNVTKANAKNS